MLVILRKVCAYEDRNDRCSPSRSYKETCHVNNALKLNLNGCVNVAAQLDIAYRYSHVAFCNQCSLCF